VSTAAYARWRVFPPLALGTVMATLDISVVNIALPTLSATFRVPLTTVEWVVLAYVLTLTGLLLTLARIADAIGRRRVYAAGIVVFAVGSALCAAAPGAWTLIAARALQGFGAAMMTANSVAILIAHFPENERGRAVGAFGAMVGIGLALGPPVGGMLVRASWRWIFLVNLPIAALAFQLLMTRVPPDDTHRHEAAPLDGPGALLWCAALVLVTLGLSWGPAAGWGAPRVWAAFAIGLLLLAAFFARERRAVAPLIPPGALRGPLGAVVTLTLIGQALAIAVGFHMPLYLEGVLGFDASRSGRWIAVMPLLALVTAPLAGRAADAWGSRRLSTIGLLVTALGLATLAALGVAVRPLVILGGMALVGAGLGLFNAPNASAVMSAVPRERLGLASGLQGTMRNLGTAAGAAVSAAILASRYTAHGGGVLRHGGRFGFGTLAFARASRDLYLVLAAVALVAVALAWKRPAAAATGQAQVRQGEV
jgi:EmrB/QacA subfamily drug resistance transporter